MAELFDGANPILVFLTGIVLLFAGLQLVGFVIRFLLFVGAWLLKLEGTECGWHSKTYFQCTRRFGHFGKHRQ